MGDAPKRKKDYSTFNTFIYKVLKQVHPDTGITSGAMASVDNFIKINLEKLINNSNLLLVHSGKKTLGSNEIRSSVWLTVDGELASNSNREGLNAVNRFNASQNKNPPGDANRWTASARAGILFPVSRIRTKWLKELSVANRVGEDAGVYLSAVLEYLTAELLENAGKRAKDAGRVRITPRHLKLTIEADAELEKLTRDVYIPGGVQVQPKKTAAENEETKEE